VYVCAFFWLNLQLLEQLKAAANEAQRKRPLRKARSERISTSPSKKQDPIMFQALCNIDVFCAYVCFWLLSAVVGAVESRSKRS
jgi:hypothetical protein